MCGLCELYDVSSILFLFTSLEMLDKVEPPSIPEGYAMSVAFSALLDLVRGITSIIEKELAREEEIAATKKETEPCPPAQAEENQQEPREFDY